MALEPSPQSRAHFKLICSNERREERTWNFGSGGGILRISRCHASEPHVSRDKESKDLLQCYSVLRTPYRSPNFVDCFQRLSLDRTCSNFQITGPGPSFRPSHSSRVPWLLGKESRTRPDSRNRSTQSLHFTDRYLGRFHPESGLRSPRTTDKRVRHVTKD